jgi:hypothetical protein
MNPACFSYSNLETAGLQSGSMAVAQSDRDWLFGFGFSRIVAVASLGTWFAFS